MFSRLLYIKTFTTFYYWRRTLLITLLLVFQHVRYITHTNRVISKMRAPGAVDVGVYRVLSRSRPL